MLPFYHLGVVGVKHACRQADEEGVVLPGAQWRDGARARGQRGGRLVHGGLGGEQRQGSSSAVGWRAQLDKQGLLARSRGWEGETGSGWSGIQITVSRKKILKIIRKKKNI